ncbi:hypothetical protein J1614_003929 [Plenodomus biglobosus]|nr:hypothetical protein J1614_003929 [Plenodomus biglobosus]
MQCILATATTIMETLGGSLGFSAIRAVLCIIMLELWMRLHRRLRADTLTLSDQYIPGTHSTNYRTGNHIIILCIAATLDSVVLQYAHTYASTIKRVPLALRHLANAFTSKSHFQHTARRLAAGPGEGLQSANKVFGVPTTLKH